MSTKSHFIEGIEVEGFEEKSEPQAIFGKFKGYNVYMYWDAKHIHGISLEDDYVILTVTPFEAMPAKFKVWGDAVLEFNYDKDGLMLKLKGGHHVTTNIIKGKYSQSLVF